MINHPAPGSSHPALAAAFCRSHFSGARCEHGAQNSPDGQPTAPALPAPTELWAGGRPRASSDPPGTPATMVKCLVKIKTKVSVHLRLINHCCREVRVRVLALGPRLLARALGALPLLPALPGPDVGHGHAPGEAVGLGVWGGPTATAPGGAGCGSGCGEHLVAPLMGRYYPVLGLVSALRRFPSCWCWSHGARRWQGRLGRGWHRSH